MLPGNGFMLCLVTVPLLVWVLYNLARAISDPPRRKFRLAQIGIWVFALAATAGVHALYHYRARQYADEIVVKIGDWRAAHGHYPRSIEDIGMNREELRSRRAVYGYGAEDIYPRLFYADTFEIYVHWYYDFERKEWVTLR
jgi:hypothetical protein